MSEQWHVTPELQVDPIAKTRIMRYPIFSDSPMPKLLVGSGHDEERANQIVREHNAHDEFVYTAQLFIDFHGMDTKEFVDKYGPNVSTKTLGDHLRHALATARGEL